MPLQRRMPKVGFRSKIKATRAEVRLSELNGIDAAVIDLEVLRKAGVADVFAEQAKVMLSGELKKAVTLKGIGATKGAAEAIAKAGGRSRPAEAAAKAKAQGKPSGHEDSTMNPAAPWAGRLASARFAAAWLFLFGALIVYRIGTFIPVPGIDPERIDGVLRPDSPAPSWAWSTCSRAARWSACPSSRWA